MHTTVMDIGPADAQLLLEFNTNNRQLTAASARRIEHYAKAMKAGRWRLNGASISVWEDVNGTKGPKGALHLLNGQHRLHAVIKADVTQKFLIVYEDDPSIFATFDVGLARNTATLLELSGVPRGYAAQTQALASHALKYERSPKAVWEKNMVSADDVLEWVHDQDEQLLHQALLDYSNLRYSVKTLGFWYAALSYLVRRDSPNANRWLEFHGGMTSGAMLDREDPRLALRNIIILRQVARGDDWRRQSSMAMGIKAWNDFLVGAPRKLLTFRADELRTSGMPAIK